MAATWPTILVFLALFVSQSKQDDACQWQKVSSEEFNVTICDASVERAVSMTSKPICSCRGDTCIPTGEYESFCPERISRMRCLESTLAIDACRVQCELTQGCAAVHYHVEDHVCGFVATCVLLELCEELTEAVGNV